MIYEIRNYYFEPSRLDEYRTWIQSGALDYIRREVDLRGFWINGDADGEVIGAPMDDLGSANITWIIAWNDLAERNDRMNPESGVFSTAEWADLFQHVPGGIASYLRMEVKFAEQMMT